MTDIDETPLGKQEVTAPGQGSRAKRRPYQAFCISSEEQRYLEMRFKFPEPDQCPSNAMLMQIQADGRMGTGITLQYGAPRQLAMVVIIKGRNLLELYPAVKQWKVEWIAEFNPFEYEQPIDNSASFIRSITIHVKRPEMPPKDAKRH